jgi:hypothetical protein
MLLLSTCFSACEKHDSSNLCEMAATAFAGNSPRWRSAWPSNSHLHHVAPSRFRGQHMRTTATSSQFSQPKYARAARTSRPPEPTIAVCHRRRAAVGLPSRSKRHASLRRSGAERGGLHCGLRLRRVPVPRRGGRVPASESASSSPSAGGIRMKLAHAIFPQRAQAWLHRGDRRRPHQQQLSTNALTGVVAVYAGSGPEPRRSP